MAGKTFQLTAQLVLKGPDTSRALANLKKLSGGKIHLDSSALTVANAQAKQLQTTLTALTGSATTYATNMGKAAKATRGQGAAAASTATQTRAATSAMADFGRVSGLAIRRFAGFTIATTVVFGLVRAIGSAFREAVQFEREMVKVSQVTGQSIQNLRGLTDEISRLSTSLGVSSKELVGITRILAQTGLTAHETKIALETLAKTTLAPTFGDINKTTEGSIALMRQFKISVNDLDQALGSVNAVAGKFAVEADDILSAVKRTGGVFFAASDGIKKFNGEAVSGLEKFQQFIALFTSIRATTRETAETIGTGLRTIFTRIQRQSTIEQLRKVGIELEDANGKFIGADEAVKRLNAGLGGLNGNLETTSKKFRIIAELVGGFRQVGKTIPLIRGAALALDVLQVAKEGQASLDKDAVIAQRALAVQFAKVREEVVKFIREISETGTLREFLTLVLDLTKGIIKLANSLKVILPLLGPLLLFRGIRAGGRFLGGFPSGVKGAGRFQKGGQVPGFNTGGFNGRVQGPSVGRDNTLVAVEGGEFVMRSKVVTPSSLPILRHINKEGLQRAQTGGLIDGFQKGGFVDGGENSGSGTRSRLREERREQQRVKQQIDREYNANRRLTEAHRKRLQSAERERARQRAEPRGQAPRPVSNRTRTRGLRQQIPGSLAAAPISRLQSQAAIIESRPRARVLAATPVLSERIPPQIQRANIPPVIGASRRAAPPVGSLHSIAVQNQAIKHFKQMGLTAAQTSVAMKKFSADVVKTGDTTKAFANAQKRAATIQRRLGPQSFTAGLKKRLTGFKPGPAAGIGALLVGQQLQQQGGVVGAAGGALTGGAFASFLGIGKAGVGAGAIIGGVNQLVKDSYTRQLNKVNKQLADTTIQLTKAFENLATGVDIVESRATVARLAEQSRGLAFQTAQDAVAPKGIIEGIASLGVSLGIAAKGGSALEAATHRQQIKNEGVFGFMAQFGEEGDKAFKEAFRDILRGTRATAQEISAAERTSIIQQIRKGAPRESIKIQDRSNLALAEATSLKDIQDLLKLAEAIKNTTNVANKATLKENLRSKELQIINDRFISVHIKRKNIELEAIRLTELANNNTLKLIRSFGIISAIAKEGARRRDVALAGTQNLVEGGLGRNFQPGPNVFSNLQAFTQQTRRQEIVQLGDELFGFGKERPQAFKNLEEAFVGTDTLIKNIADMEILRQKDVDKIVESAPENLRGALQRAFDQAFQGIDLDEAGIASERVVDVLQKFNQGAARAAGDLRDALDNTRRVFIQQLEHQSEIQRQVDRSRIASVRQRQGRAGIRRQILGQPGFGAAGTNLQEQLRVLTQAQDPQAVRPKGGPAVDYRTRVLLWQGLGQPMDANGRPLPPHPDAKGNQPLLPLPGRQNRQIFPVGQQITASALGARRTALQRERTRLLSSPQGPGTERALQENTLNLERVKQALELLSKDTTQLADIQRESAQNEARRQAAGRTLENLFLASPQERAVIDQQIKAYKAFRQTGQLGPGFIGQQAVRGAQFLQRSGVLPPQEVERIQDLVRGAILDIIPGGGGALAIAGLNRAQAAQPFVDRFDRAGRQRAEAGALLQQDIENRALQAGARAEQNRIQGVERARRAAGGFQFGEGGDPFQEADKFAFNKAALELGAKLDNLAKAKLIPDKVELAINEPININMNGAEVFNQLKPEMRKIFVDEIQKGLRKHLNQLHPEQIAEEVA
jgi:TP901 family phage tail tape measure protein